MQICKTCIYDSTVSEISFDQDGVCNYCHQVKSLKKQYNTGSVVGKNNLNKIVNKIKIKGKNKKYDCIVGVSGGVDSSFMLHWAVSQGLRPIAVHYDNTWNSEIATMNIAKITKSLDVDLYTYVVNNKEMDNIYKAFFAACVPAIDIVTDLGFTEILYRVAKKFRIEYVLEGHSFIEEGISPVGYSYFDGKYIEDICKKHGVPKFETYPLMRFMTFMKWIIIYRIKKIRPYWYLDYSKEKAKSLLSKKYGWKYYGGHHLENRMTAFSHSYHNPIKFGMDQRNNMLSALVRNGSMDRKKAIESYSSGPEIDVNLKEYVLNRLNYSSKEFNKIINSKNMTWKDFKSYKNYFEKLKPLFYVLAKLDLVPMSFYLKYCFKIKDSK